MKHDNSVITDAKKIDKKKWADFVYNHSYGDVFQTPEMYEVYQNTKNYEPVFISAVDEKGEILRILLM
jgi:lipid II:glycine glycyltransferase (peptidoglycan interpeptide bridge formation enzyme)